MTTRKKGKLKMKHKSWRLLSWIIAIIITALFSFTFIDHESTLLYLNFETYKPLIYRVIVPVLANALLDLGVPIDLTIPTVMFLSGILVYWQLEKLFAGYGAEIFTSLCFSLLHLIMYFYAKPMDYLTVFFFTLSYNLFRSYSIRDLKIYLLLFPIMVLHRETAILLIFLYVLLFYKFLSRRSLIITSAYQCLTYATIRILLMKIFFDAPGTDIYPFEFDVLGWYLHTPAMISALFIVIGTFKIVYARWERLDPFLRAGFTLFPIQIFLHLILGFPFEFRVLAESFPIVCLVTFLCLFPASYRQTTQIELDQKDCLESAHALESSLRVRE